jgi:hypothetical protein
MAAVFACRLAGERRGTWPHQAGFEAGEGLGGLRPAEEAAHAGWRARVAAGTAATPSRMPGVARRGCVARRPSRGPPAAARAVRSAAREPGSAADASARRDVDATGGDGVRRSPENRRMRWHSRQSDPIGQPGGSDRSKRSGRRATGPCGHGTRGRRRAWPRRAAAHARSSTALVPVVGRLPETPSPRARASATRSRSAKERLNRTGNRGGLLA